MATNAEYLSEVPLFSRLERASMASFADACVRLKTKPGEVLFHEGDSGGALYVILGGRLRIERQLDSGEVQVLGTRGIGEFIGEMSLVDGEPRSATVVSATGCRLLVLQRAEFERLILTEPKACLALLRSMSVRIREAANQISDYRSKEIWERLLERFREEADADGVVRLRGSQASLADELSCTREAANRAIRQLEQKGHIERLATRILRLIPTSNNRSTVDRIQAPGKL